jgi:hypothetical protein
MRPKTTRTLNPLPFQDLEPHRFEDLVRQLAYDLRQWRSLEATGRGGADDGLDIRAVESVGQDVDDGPDEGDEVAPAVAEERLWRFQCKREKSLTPKRIGQVVSESLPANEPRPHAFVLAVACYVSKKARDVFRAEMVARGIEEFLIWSRSELEDMLFQPKNDRLLFAYFGISLQPRRRSAATALRSEIALKKQLNALFGEEDHRDKYVLLRDVSDERYPRKPKKGEPRAKWVVCSYLHVRQPRHLAVLWREHPAWIMPDGRWDALIAYDHAASLARSHLHSLRNDHRRDDHDDGIYVDFWREYVPEVERGWLKVARFVPLDRVLAIDSLGDGPFPIPHILVEFRSDDGPFASSMAAHWFERSGNGWFQAEPDEEKRTKLFPDPLPGAVLPPLPEFDASTSTRRADLSAPVGEKLATALDALRAARRASGEQRNDAPADVSTHLAEYRKWRDEVALPVFAAFIDRLRVAGQDGRIVTRAAPEDGTSAAAVELRLFLDGGIAHNPSYRRTGHLRVEAHANGHVRLEVDPKQESQGARYGETPTPKLADWTKERLEGEVLQLIERLRTRSY